MRRRSVSGLCLPFNSVLVFVFFLHKRRPSAGFPAFRTSQNPMVCPRARLTVWALECFRHESSTRASVFCRPGLQGNNTAFGRGFRVEA